MFSKSKVTLGFKRLFRKIEAFLPGERTLKEENENHLQISGELLSQDKK